MRVGRPVPFDVEWCWSRVLIRWALWGFESAQSLRVQDFPREYPDGVAIDRRAIEATGPTSCKEGILEQPAKRRIEVLHRSSRGLSFLDARLAKAAEIHWHPLGLGANCDGYHVFCGITARDAGLTSE
jgi:hypothetical protein